MASLKIRKYRKSDKAQVRDLIVDVWGRRWLPGVLHAFEDYEGFVAEKDNRIVGGFTLDNGSYACLLDELIVSTANQSSGIGTKMLEYALARSKKKGMKFVKTFVEYENKPALDLYKKYGFKKFGELRNSFEPGDHYLYMCKFL